MRINERQSCRCSVHWPHNQVMEEETKLSVRVMTPSTQRESKAMASTLLHTMYWLLSAVPKWLSFLRPYSQACWLQWIFSHYFDVTCIYSLISSLAIKNPAKMMLSNRHKADMLLTCVFTTEERTADYRNPWVGSVPVCLLSIGYSTCEGVRHWSLHNYHMEIEDTVKGNVLLLAVWMK